jgi:[ribosomal protein S5]-alanine N-acetyltransferase
MLLTDRLRLIPASVEMAQADLRGRTELERVLDVRVPESWPPDLFDAPAVDYIIQQLTERPSAYGWWLYYFILNENTGSEPVLVGAGGYKGEPDADGSVEIGYSIVPEQRRQGYATEATSGLVAQAFADPRVNRVIAETLPELAPSIGVLKKCGFTYIGVGSEKGVIRYEMTRAAYEQHHDDQPKPTLAESD